MSIYAKRYHDISCGHRVAGHENKCAHLHGHNYRIHFSCYIDKLDSLGRVLDFSAIKARLCEWLEENWDHKFLCWERDEVMRPIRLYASDEYTRAFARQADNLADIRAGALSFVVVPFNPTAENMAAHLLHIIGPQQLEGTGVTLESVIVEETRKCSAEVKL